MISIVYHVHLIIPNCIFSFFQIQITTLCISISLSAYTTLFCLFSPKLYIIVFQVKTYNHFYQVQWWSKYWTFKCRNNLNNGLKLVGYSDAEFRSNCFSFIPKVIRTAETFCAYCHYSNGGMNNQPCDNQTSVFLWIPDPHC